MSPPINDNWGSATALSGSGNIAGTTTDATRELAEPNADTLDWYIPWFDGWDGGAWVQFYRVVTTVDIPAGSTWQLPLPANDPPPSDPATMFLEVEMYLTDPGQPSLPDYSPGGGTRYVTRDSDGSTGGAPVILADIPAGSTLYFIAQQWSDVYPSTHPADWPPAFVWDIPNDGWTWIDNTSAPIDPTPASAFTQLTVGPQGPSVWYSWVPAAGAVSVSTDNEDMSISVFTGSSLAGLSLVDADYNNNGLEGLIYGISKAQWMADGITTYYIRIMAYDDVNVGDFTLTYLALANDDFANAQVLAGTDSSGIVSGEVTGIVAGATLETGEPDVDQTSTGVTGTNTVWYKWTAEHSGAASVLVSGVMHLVFDVWTGTTLAGLTLIGAVDQPSGMTTSVTFSAVADTVYYVRVNSYDTSSSGTFTVDWTLTYAPIVDAAGIGNRTSINSAGGTVNTPPANDDQANAIALSGGSGSYSSFSTVASTLEIDEDPLPGTAIPGEGSVWFTWDPAGATGATTFTVPASTGIEAYIVGGTVVGSGTGSLTIDLRSGETYYLRAYAVTAESDALTISWATSVQSFSFTLITTEIVDPPGTLQASIDTDQANGTINLYLDGSSSILQTETLDPNGDDINFDVQIPTLTDGSHTLRAVLVETGQESSVTFTSSTDQNEAGDGLLPSDPDYPIFTAPAANRWRLTDPTDLTHWDFPINPSAVDSPTLPKVLTSTATTSPNGQAVVYEGGQTAKVWTFSGDLLTKVDEDALVVWTKKPWRVYITDDFGRTYLILFAQLQTTPVRDIEHPDHVTYKATTYFFGMPTIPAVTAQPPTRPSFIKPTTSTYADAGQAIVRPGG